MALIVTMMVLVVRANQMSSSSCFVVLLLFCLSFIFILFSTTVALAQVLDKTYSNKECGISFQYPSNWKLEEVTWDEEKGPDQPEVTNFIVELEPDVDKGYNNVLSVELDDISVLPDSSFDAIRNYEHDTLRSVNQAQGLSTMTTQISGFPAEKMVFNEELPGMKESEKFKTMKTIIVAYDKEYVILYDSFNAYYDKYISTVEKILRTFKISTPNYEGIRCQIVPPKNIPENNFPSVVNTSNPEATQSNDRQILSNDTVLKTILEKTQESMRNR
jgi:adenylate kinase family enzyme